MNWQTPNADPLATIGEISAKTGLSPRTVRYYEELGLLPGVRRRAGGRRVYGRDELERLRFIQRLKGLGLSLAEIGELNAVHGIAGSTRAMLQRLDELLDRQLEEVDTRLEDLESLRSEIQSYRDHVRTRIQGRRRGNGRARKGGDGRAGKGGGR